MVQAARPSTNDPRSEVRFIERRLLNDGTIELAHVPVRPDTQTQADELEDASAGFYVGPTLRGQSYCQRNVLRGCEYG